MRVENFTPGMLLEEDKARLQSSIDLDPYKMTMEEHFKLVEEDKEQIFVFSWVGARIVMLTAVLNTNLHVVHIGGNILNSANAHEMLWALASIAKHAGVSAITATVVNKKVLTGLVAMGFCPIAVELKLEV